MKNYTLIGHPLGHSMSPVIHDKLFKLKGRSCSYTLTDILPENLADKAEYLRKLDGFNITIPHKVNIIPMIDSLGESAKRYNSVNCVNKEDGKLIGYNTDCEGFLLSVTEFPLYGNVLLIGCGGVGRMMAVETAIHGGLLTLAIIPEALAQAQQLKAEILKSIPDAKITIISVTDLCGKYDVILNASPVGMYPKTDVCPVSDDVISGCGYVFDAVYNPVETMLIKKARACGKTAVGGAAMLVYQAVKAHEIWDGDLYTEEEIGCIVKDVEAKINE